MHVNCSSSLFDFVRMFEFENAIYFKYNYVMPVFLYFYFRYIQNKTNNNCECQCFKNSKSSIRSQTQNMFELQTDQNNKNLSIGPKHNWLGATTDQTCQLTEATAKSKPNGKPNNGLKSHYGGLVNFICERKKGKNHSTTQQKLITDLSC